MVTSSKTLGTLIANAMEILTEIVTEILARLPLRSISRFKSVSKTWKSIIESVYLRRLYVSLHQNSSSWSLMCCRAKELIGFYGCETWDLRKSLASFIPWSHFHYEASSNGLVLIKGYRSNSCHPCYFVGNPVLQQWVKIPPSPDGSSSVFDLMMVTRVDDDGVVLDFKVVRLASLWTTNNNSLSDALSVFLYSSETGLWTSKIIHCPHQITNLGYMIYYTGLIEPGKLVAHDLYSESDHFRVIPLPDHPNNDNGDLKSAFTTSGGFVMCMRTLTQKEETVLKVWRLNNDDSWQLLWKISLPMFIGDCVPMAMHPFDSDIVYLWSQQNRHSVSCNLRTQNNEIIRDNHQDCFMNLSNCEEYMDMIYLYKNSVKLLQYVLPRWMESMPCPPQVG